MATLKAEKPAGTQLFGPAKKEAGPAKVTDKSAASKSTAKKPAPKESKKKGKGGKSGKK